jgi:adenosine deaminase
MVTKKLLRCLPKTDLHVHLDGSLRVETLLDLAPQAGLRLPADEPEELRGFLQVDGTVENLARYIEKFQITLQVMQTREALHRIAYELAEDAAAENIRYMEVRYAPILHQRKGLLLPEILDSVLAGLRDAETDFGIRTGVIICGIRSINPENSLRLAELAVAYKGRGVVAFDLAGVEYNYPAKDHIRAFYHVRNNNINCTLHAGEAYGPESIHQAIHYCGAHRIGHGTRLIEDEDLMAYVNDHRIPLEICLTSNVQTRSVRRLAAHPFRRYFDAGIRVTVNTDNRLISGTTVTDELFLAASTFELSLEDIKKVVTNGFKSAFLPYEERADLLHRVTEELAKY